MKEYKIIFTLFALANLAVLTFESDNADILFFLAFLNLLVCMIYFLDLINLKKDLITVREALKRVEDLWRDTSDREFKLLEERGIIVAMLDEAVSQAKIYKDRNPLQSEIDELHKARKDLSKEAQKINELNR